MKIPDQISEATEDFIDEVLREFATFDPVAFKLLCQCLRAGQHVQAATCLADAVMDYADQCRAHKAEPFAAENDEAARGRDRAADQMKDYEIERSVR